MSNITAHLTREFGGRDAAALCPVKPCDLQITDATLHAEPDGEGWRRVAVRYVDASGDRKEQHFHGAAGERVMRLYMSAMIASPGCAQAVLTALVIGRTC